MADAPAGRMTTCTCRECENARHRHNALIANGLLGQARAVARTYGALQRAHAVSALARETTAATAREQR